MKKYFIVCIPVLIVALFSCGAMAHDQADLRQISVSGECTHVVSPDRGSITLTVEYQNMNLSIATKDAAKSYERLANAIKKLKLKNLNMRTSEYSVNEITAWENKRQVKKGFRARMGLWVSTSDIQRIGEIIALASKEKVKDVNSLQTFLSDEKQLAEEMACLKDAAHNARQKAQKLASSLNANLGDVLMVNESGKNLPSYPRPMMQKSFGARGMAMEMDHAAPQVEAGQQNLSLSVQVTFALK